VGIGCRAFCFKGAPPNGATLAMMNPTGNQVIATMPALARHRGVWEGSYRVVDVMGQTLDWHRSRIEVRFPDDGPYDYLQSNHFAWPDGRELRVEHPAVCRNGVLLWDTEHIKGQAWSVDERSTVLTWRRHDNPDAHLYELIVINDSNDQRSRTWHWFRNGTLYQRTLIDEKKVAP
jgi:hypothetical protein